MELLRKLQARGVLSPLDRHFAATLGTLLAEDEESAHVVLLAAALASRAVQRGHVCVDLSALHDVPLLDADEQPVTDVELPDVDAWCAALRASPLVTSDGGAEERTPLVLEDGGRLYLRRYADYQRALVARIRDRLEHAAGAADGQSDVHLGEALDRLFPAGEGAAALTEAQRRAAAIAVQRSFAVISGGPGTGKTTTVVKILALLQEQALAARGEPLRILLLAPTGKAAQRLSESVAGQIDGLACSPAVKDALPRTAATIHRTLQWQPRTPTRFRHDADHPLPTDVVVVDEASMVDLALMAKLVAAVPPAGRLILLGDRDQLASVEAGAIFGDLCGDEGAGAGYSAEFAAATRAATGEELPVGEGAEPGIRDSVVHLTHSFRYAAGSAIDTVARAVNDGDADGAVAALREADPGEAALHEASTPDALRAALEDLVMRTFAGLVEGEPADRLRRLQELRILCAHRRGPLGAEEVNASIEEWLSSAGILAVDGDWYDGRPIMIQRNDYQLDLFNGDVGVIAAMADGTRHAWFPGEGDTLRRFVPARLPPHETVFATTVHKSQGSEFTAVALVLPAEVSPILSRELIYTGVTRARESVAVFGPVDVLRAAIDRRIERASGLRDALWS